MASKTGKKAANAAEKARQTHKPDAAQRKNAACRRKLLAKNDRKRKDREARQIVAPTAFITEDQQIRYAQAIGD